MAQRSFAAHQCKQCFEWWRTLLYIRDGVSVNIVEDVFSNKSHEATDKQHDSNDGPKMPGTQRFLDGGKE